MSAAPQHRAAVFQLVTNFKLGGTERHVSNLVRLLDRSQFDLRVGCLRRCGEFLEEVERDCGPVDEYAIRRLYTPAAWARQVAFAADLRRRRVELVHTYGFYANVFGVPAARLAGVPVIVASIRDSGDHLSPARRWLQRRVCALADCVLVNAEAVRQRLLGEGYAPRSLSLIRGGIDLRRFRPRVGADELRASLGLPARVPLVTVVSRLNPLKGLETFLEAAARVAARRPEARFLVAGDAAAASYRAGLERLAAGLGLRERVLFLGFRRDVPELLGASNVSVLPSLSEGLSNVLLESMAVGVPTVATRVGGQAEAVEHGVTGLLVAPGDAPELAHAVTLLLEHPHLGQCYAQAARQRVRERFSDERMARDTEDFYRDWLARKARSRGRRVLHERTA